MLISKIIFLKKYILIHFRVKRILKNNRNYRALHLHLFFYNKRYFLVRLYINRDKTVFLYNNFKGYSHIINLKIETQETKTYLFN